MSAGKVDVLAVMGRAAEYHRDEAKTFGGGEAGSLRAACEANAERTATEIAEARAAVAELIEAARPFAATLVAEDSMCHDGIVGTGDCSRCGPILRLRAALARIGGAS